MVGPMRRAWVGLGVVCAAALAPRPAAASPEDIFGYGPRSEAMGATGAAAAHDYEATYANPALLSRIREPRLALGLQGATFDLHASGTGLPGKVSARPAKGVDIGVDLPIPFGGALKNRVAGGLAFYTPTDVLVRGSILYPETPQFPLLPDRTQCLAIRLGVGADIGHGFRLGVGFGALAEIVGDVIVATDSSGRVGSKVEDQLIAVYAPIVGASWEHPLAGGTLRVGATFRGKLDARFAVAIDATKLSSLALPVFNIAGLAQFDPLQVALDAAWEKRGWVLTAGLTFKHWSEYPGPFEGTIQCPEDEPDCGSLTPPEIGFSDTLVPRIGAEYTFRLPDEAALHVRGGYFFEPSPVPGTLPSSQAYSPAAQTLVDVPTRFFDASRHVLTAGVGVSLRAPVPVSIDAFTQLHVLHPRTLQLEAGDGAGGTSTADLSGAVFATGVVVGVGF